jgi:hypothetical protein
MNEVIYYSMNLAESVISQSLMARRNLTLSDNSVKDSQQDKA